LEAGSPSPCRLLFFCASHSRRLIFFPPRALATNLSPLHLSIPHRRQYGPSPPCKSSLSVEIGSMRNFRMKPVALILYFCPALPALDLNRHRRVFLVLHKYFPSLSIFPPFLSGVGRSGSCPFRGVTSRVLLFPLSPFSRDVSLFAANVEVLSVVLSRPSSRPSKELEVLAQRL